MDAKSDYYFGIDAIRFVSALLVVLFHLSFSCWVSPTSGATKVLAHAYKLPSWAPFTWFGWVGVEIFFVISGLVIALSAEKSTPYRFVTGRALRLYPAVWICAPITAALAIWLDTFSSVRKLLNSLTLFPPGPFIDGQYWTLGVEIVFYVCTLAFIVIKRTQWLQWFGLALAAYSLTFLVVLEYVPSLDSITRGPGRLLLANYGGYFALGLAIRSWAVGRHVLTYYATAGLAFMAAALEIRHHSWQVAASSIYSPIDVAPLWWLPFVVFVTAMGAIAATIRYRSNIAALPASYRNVLREAGLTTYPLYLIHFSAGVATARFLVNAGLSSATAVFISIAIMVIVAFLLGRYVERRLRSLLANALRWSERSFITARTSHLELK